MVVDSHLQTLEGPQLTPPAPMKKYCNIKLQLKLVSVNEVLGLQKYRIFLHYLFIIDKGGNQRDSSKLHLESLELCC